MRCTGPGRAETDYQDIRLGIPIGLALRSNALRRDPRRTDESRSPGSTEKPPSRKEALSRALFVHREDSGTVLLQRVSDSEI